MIPAELEGMVSGVFGLDQRRVARRSGSPAVETAKAGSTDVNQDFTTTSLLAPLSPADIETLYHFPSGDADGQTIAIAEFGGGLFRDDLAAYCHKFGRRVPTVKTVAVNRQPLTLAQIQLLPEPFRTTELDDSHEVMLDVEIIAGLCPKAEISVFFATPDQKGWIDLLNAVIRARPMSLSISWGGPEDSPDGSAAMVTAINAILSIALVLGITVCVSSGDDGSGDQVNDFRAHVNFPASCPFALSIGGTEVTGSLDHPNEQTWWDFPGRRTTKGGGASGGGVSTIFSRPSWQKVRIPSVNKDSIDGRIVPDVAAVAGKPFYAHTFLGHDTSLGGTSASAPVWASLIARVNEHLPAAKQRKLLLPLLYMPDASGHPMGRAVCRDIKTGMNNASIPIPGVGYAPQAGYDAVTGWGVPNGKALLNALKA